MCFFGFPIDSGLAYDILAIGLTLLALVIALGVSNVLFRRIERRMTDKGRDVKSLCYLRRGVKLVIYIICITAALRHVPGMNSIVTSVLAGSGIAAVVIGLASQQALGNVVSGAVLLVFRPFQVGDTIRYLGPNADGVKGVVEEIGLRHTTIRTGEDKQLLIPNSLMNSNIVENLTCGKGTEEQGRDD